MAAAEEGPEPLKYQTLALKVSTHCEGCKREVKRILNMEGVYRISFGPQQHKVVVIGNVAAETLVKKLTKSGKHAELWPEPLPDENAGGGGGGKKKKKKKKKKSKNKSDGMPNAPPEVPENNQSSSGDESSPEAPDKPEGESPKSDDKEPPPAQEKPNGTEKAAATNAGGGKKKGKKNHNANNNNNSGGGGNPGGPGGPPQEFGKKAAGGLAIPPALNLPFYSTSQLPSYVVSYSSVHPSNNYGGAYHPAAPMQHGNFVYSTAAPGSCYIFSEENANACSVM
ncbi:unnamed protein product [Musa banksii]